jgi:hypothetical protein
MIYSALAAADRLNLVQVLYREYLMNSTKLSNARLLPAVAIMLSLACAAMAAGSAQDNAQAQHVQNDHMVMYLGKVEVRGEKNIIKTLQAIKVGLRQPYSTDPKLANVVVCRLQDEPGSHLKQWLICGSNRILAANRNALHTAMTAAFTSTDAGEEPGDPGSLTCMSEECYTQVFSTLSETLNSQPGQYLDTLVNGPSLHNLLQKIPDPVAQQTAAFAPTAVAHHP